MKQLFTLLIFLSVLTISCGTQGVLHDYQDTEIVFGSGGGFTGQVTEYHLDTEGNLKMIESLAGNETTMGKVKKSDLKKIFSALSALNLAEMEINHPGNMTYFIKEINKEASNEVIWGSEDYTVPDELQGLYDLLIASMN